jgi:hypothetical protein
MMKKTAQKKTGSRFFSWVEGSFIKSNLSGE